MKAKRIWFEDGKIFIITDKDLTLWQSLLWYPKLLNADTKQRENYRTNAFGIRWDDIDEDVSFESFKYNDPEPNVISKIFRQHPELNVSAVARHLGMKQSLLAAYIYGTKTPSKERTEEIIRHLHLIGQELMSV